MLRGTMNVFVGLGLFVLNVHYASGIQCYDCFMGCNDPFDSSGVKKSECDGYCTKTEIDGNVKRSCFSSKVKKDSCEEAAGSSMCFCTSDLCNGQKKFSWRIILYTSFDFICVGICDGGVSRTQVRSQGAFISYNVYEIFECDVKQSNKLLLTFSLLSLSSSQFHFEFENSIWKDFKCEIHTFDPSHTKRGVQIPNGVNFHLIGLSDNDSTIPAPESLKDFPTWPMKRLSSIKRSFRHEKRYIDILKIDIEGFEWKVLPDVIKSRDLRYVRQIC
ncbi:uncharacterized protein LOC132729046 [Ruditapes philippinarum]|uniref:uncharacterized protein LOC132729046 n=1 Tax=Ruditapes philippinarum TaxID=129788 RepID=UPI00295AA96A|nr:uncharacterized protein LOC132729046 [Ruditapes philippinarum]